MAVATAVLAGGVPRSIASPIDTKKAEAARLAAQVDAAAQRIADVASRLTVAKAKLAATDAAVA